MLCGLYKDLEVTGCSPFVYWSRNPVCYLGAGGSSVITNTRTVELKTATSADAHSLEWILIRETHHKKEKCHLRERYCNLQKEPCRKNYYPIFINGWLGDTIPKISMCDKKKR